LNNFLLEVFVKKETMFPPNSARGIGDEGVIFSVNSPLEPGDSGSLPFPPQCPFQGYPAAGAESLSSSSARSDIDIPSSREENSISHSSQLLYLRADFLEDFTMIQAKYL